MADQPTTRPAIRPLAERLAAQNRQAEEPMVCESCGSTFFFMTHVHQYSKPTGYSSTDSRTLTITPIPVRVCLCGNIVPPAGSATIGAPSERQAFQASIELAQKKLESADPNNLVKALASVQELEELRKRVDDLDNRTIASVPFENPQHTPQISDEDLNKIIAATKDATPPAGKKKQPKPKE